MGSDLCRNPNQTIDTLPELEKEAPSPAQKSSDGLHADLNLKSAITIENREEVSSLPLPNNHVQERINKLSKMQMGNNRMWKVKPPVNIVYMNEDPKAQDDLPSGYTQIYKTKDNQDFHGFFEGRIEKDLTVNLENAIYVYSNASYFVGTGKNQGTYTNEVTNLKYEGGWKNQQPQGYGTENNNKGVYRGEYHLGEKQGQGRFTWTDGMSFQGGFLKGLFHGKGHLQDPTIRYSYVGDYSFGEKHGQGIEKHAASMYEGQFYKGKRFGKGRLTVYEDESCGKVHYVYEGNFNEGVPQGRGSYSKPQTGTKIEGIWHMGSLKAVF